VSLVRFSVVTVAVLMSSAPAFAAIERVKGLECSGNGEAFTVIFDHDEQQASITDTAGTRLFRYEQGDAFLTWRLVDSGARSRYMIRKGDAINGDLGWYFTSFTRDPLGDAELTNGGTCSPTG
jgi:hypothetical protein